MVWVTKASPPQPGGERGVRQQRDGYEIPAEWFISIARNL